MSIAGRPASSSSPPTQAQAAAIVMEASNDPSWGLFVWLVLTVGSSSAELCALRWDDIDLDAAVLTIRSAGQRHQVRLDADAVTLLRAHLAHCAAQAAILDIERGPAAHVFALEPDGATAWEPNTVAERWGRTWAGPCWTVPLDRQPRHSAADLVSAGVDVRSLEWRLLRGLSRIQRRPRA